MIATINFFSGDSIELKNIRLDLGNYQSAIIERKAIDGQREFHLGNYTNARFIIYSFKDDPIQQLTDLNLHKGEYCTITLSNAGFNFIFGNERPINFVLIGVNPYYITQTSKYDAIVLDFFTVDYRAKDIQFLIDDEGNFILTDDGQKIILEI